MFELAITSRRIQSFGSREHVECQKKASNVEIFQDNSYGTRSIQKDEGASIQGGGDRCDAGLSLQVVMVGQIGRHQCLGIDDANSLVVQ